MSDEDEDAKDLEMYRYRRLGGAVHFKPEDWRSVPEHPDINRSGKFLSCLSSRSPLKFPEPQDLNINMMPFRIDDVSSLPKNLRCWYDIINSTLREDSGNIGYLTIQESWVEPGHYQRRPGLHTDRHLNTEFDIEASVIHDGGGKIIHQPAAWHWYDF